MDKTPSQITNNMTKQKEALEKLAQEWIDSNAICPQRCRVKWYQTFFMACVETQGQGGGWVILHSFTTPDNNQHPV